MNCTSLPQHFLTTSTLHLERIVARIVRRLDDVMRTREDSFETDLKALYEAIPFAEWCKWMKPPSSLNKKQKDLSPALDTASGNAQKEEDQHHVHAFSSARNLSPIKRFSRGSY